VTAVDLTTAGGAVVRDLAHDEYLTHPALSASQAKILVQPGGPARYRWSLEHPQPPRDVFDLGHAAHAAVLGVGPALGVVDAPDWRGKVARERRDALRAEGFVPLLVDDMRRIEDMAAALREHPIASRLLHPDSGEAEVSLFWTDDHFGVDRRARVDWLRTPDADGRLIIVDYKTSSDASPAALARSVWQYGYTVQCAWYRELVVGLGLARSARFVFVFQEKDPPYLVNCVELDEEALLIGAELCERALKIYARCRDTGTWPGYSDQTITALTLPTWAVRAHYQTMVDDL
jgi:PDDEXK-like domain of unknown function (DUF3799)